MKSNLFIYLKIHKIIWGFLQSNLTKPYIVQARVQFRYHALKKVTKARICFYLILHVQMYKKVTRLMVQVAKTIYNWGNRKSHYFSVCESIWRKKISNSRKKSYKKFPLLFSSQAHDILWWPNDDISIFCCFL